MKNINQKINLPLMTKKHNSLTDGSIPSNEVLADKLLNVINFCYEKKGNSFKLTISEVYKFLGLKSRSGANDKRLLNAFRAVASPLIIRDYTYEGKNVHLLISSLATIKIYKEARNYIEINLNNEVIEAFKQKGGYTSLDLNILNKLKSKFSVKLYEMYKRYKTLPNNKDKDFGEIKKNIEELNFMFSTKYKHKADLLSKVGTKSLKPINRALNEIKAIADEEIECEYDDIEKLFIFTWNREILYPKLRIPYQKINDLIKWYLQLTNNGEIRNMSAYASQLRTKILRNEFENLDEYYRSLLTNVYGIEDWKKHFDIETLKYLDFDVKTQTTFDFDEIKMIQRDDTKR